MDIRVARGTYDAGRLEELERALDWDCLPALKQAPGFRNFWSGREGGRWASVTVWEAAGQADVTASLRGSLEAAGLRVESAEECEVSRQVSDEAPANATWTRVVRGSHDEGRADDLLRVANEVHTPAAQQLPGFQGLLAGREKGRSGTVLFFNTSSTPERAPTSIMDALSAAGFCVESIDEFQVHWHV